MFWYTIRPAGDRWEIWAEGRLLSHHTSQQEALDSVPGGGAVWPWHDSGGNNTPVRRGRRKPTPQAR